MANIYITKKEFKSEIKVSEVKEYKADLKYWVTDKKNNAKNSDCKWFYVDKEHQADKIICFVKEYKADIKVAEVNREYKAKGNF
tara:strand:+ start:492 stop:743 length:252 start_codon:yes stop_codon:yes gene_type:complete